MITIDPVARALVPADSAAAAAFGAPNYDEFQSDREVWELIRAQPDSLLRVTMAHCDAPSPDRIGKADSDAALDRAAANMARLREDRRTRVERNVLWVYEITTPSRPDEPQIGLGGMARTGEIRTPDNPAGAIIRNEGIREAKARGRATLIQRIEAIVDCVNNAVDDDAGNLQRALERHAVSRPPSYETSDPAGSRHRVWIVRDPTEIERFRELLRAEPRAYVADGNHRSAAAAMLGYRHFLAVFFPARTMRISPYNRLVKQGASGVAGPFQRGDRRRRTDGLGRALANNFEVQAWNGQGAFQPTRTHEIGLYDGAGWTVLRPRPSAYDPADAAQDIDADIVQRRLFADGLGIDDSREERINYVGGNRGPDWLQAQVDAGRFDLAVTLPAVTMDQFIRVCVQDRMMPPKSTWFEPKVLSGLVMALLD